MDENEKNVVVDLNSSVTDEEQVKTNSSQTNETEDEKTSKSVKALDSVRLSASALPKITDVPQNDLDYSNFIKACNLRAKIESDKEYIGIVQDVVGFSQKNLGTINREKTNMREQLISFCINILGIQLGVLFVLILFKAVFSQFNLSDNVLTVFMTSIFVETLGAIIIMIKFAFKTDEEVQVIKILNEVVKNYQKYKESVDNDKNE